MVFSQSNIHPHNILKVVDLNSLKSEKVNGTTGTITGGDTNLSHQLAYTTPGISEVRVDVPVYLKPEPLYEDNMFNQTESEFFQDLMHWCTDSTKTEPAPIDPPKKSDDGSHNTDTLHTTFSPQSWDVLDANSPAQAGFYSSTPNDPLSPNMDTFTTFDNKFLYNSNTVNDMETKHLEQELDILNLPVVIGNLAPEEMIDLNPCPTMVPLDYCNINDTTQHTEYTPTINTNKMFLHTVDEEDSLDMKLGSVVMGEIENNNIVVFNEGIQEHEKKIRPGHQLSLNVAATPALWTDAAISTPDILSYVEQLEKEKCIPITIPQASPSPDNGFVSMESCQTTIAEPLGYFESVSPKSEPHEESDVDDAKARRYNARRKRHNSEDSDETYTPYSEETATPRKYKRRKSNIKDQITILKESQQAPKARRGRPPKRRESNVSSVCSVDDNVSCASVHEMRYREGRNKNNEASKRSRMKRKLKELEMEQEAIDLEERNKKLKVQADILEDMTKRLKDALMTAIIQKQ